MGALAVTGDSSGSDSPLLLLLSELWWSTNSNPGELSGGQIMSLCEFCQSVFGFSGLQSKGLILGEYRLLHDGRR